MCGGKSKTKSEIEGTEQWGGKAFEIQLSAQESRRKRKEYMDMLEKRVHAYFADNTQLRQKVRQLEAQNRFLATQLQRVQQQNGEGTEQQQQH